jgi:hypothetical protein
LFGFGVETSNHRPECQAGSAKNQHDQQPWRRAESLVQPDACECEEHQRDGELQSDSRELTTGYALTPVEQAVVFGLLFLLCIRRLIGQMRLESTRKLELVKFFSSTAPCRSPNPSEERLSDGSHYPLVT